MEALTEQESLIEQFLGFMETERAAAKNTITCYRQDLRRFSKFCDRHPEKPTFITVDPEILSDYYKEMESQGKTSATIDRRFSCLRTFFGYLTAEGLMRENPTAKISIPRRSRKQIFEAPTKEETESFLKLPAKLSNPAIASRDLIIIELLLDTGMLLEELVSLNVEMVNLVGPVQPYVRIVHRNRERKAPLSSWVAEHLKIYLEKTRTELGIHNPEERALLLNRWSERLTRQGIWFIIRGYAQAAELGNKITPKTLRYSFVAQQLKHGVSLNELRQLLGHAYQHTTDRLRERLQAQRLSLLKRK